jgi:FkbM family methyltransferase
MNICSSLFIDAYARLIYSVSRFLIRSFYKLPKTTSFSADKHKKMINLSNFVDKVFNLIVKVVDEKTKYDYTMPVDYEGCTLLIRPFIFSEILMTSGRWEPYVKPLLDKEVEDSNVIVDIGANIGVYAIPLAKKVSKVIAFEPHPKTSEMLEKSIKLNKLHNVLLIKKSVGDLQGKILYNLSTVPMFSGITNANDKLTSPDKVHSTIEVESIDLDTALSMESRVDWLIIDVESFEVNVLNGARKILKKYSPKIIIEVDQRNLDKVNKILTNEKYSITCIYDVYYYAVK